MAIDLLTRGSVCPIFVGDTDAIGKYERVANSGSANDLHVYLIDKEGVATEFPISRQAKESLMRNELALLVSLSKDDNIERAFQCAIDDDATATRDMGEDEIKALAEQLVAGDFTVDFIEGGDEQSPAPDSINESEFPLSSE